ncbi:MAG TPA: phage tail tape measure protein [Phycisphaerae bacterium]|nr:phage tail tape measure protein [Phycisphaerae bacterium]
MALSANIRAGGAYIELLLHDNRLVRGLKRAQYRLRRFGQSVTAIGKRMMMVSAVLAAPFAYAARTFAGFDDAMRKTKAVTGATEAEFQTLTTTAKRLGRTTSYTAAQVADAMTELGRAGFKPKEIDTAIGGILSLARATDTELPRAAEIAGNALRGFGMDVSEIDRVVDVLAYAANNSAQVLDELGESMKYVAPLAAEAGEPIESVAAALGVLANAGIKGSMAGTAVARALKNLSSEAGQKKLAGLGVQAVDAAGDLRPLGEILGELGQRVKTLGSAKRLAIFETLFGRGQAAALKLASDPNALAGLAEGLKNSAGYAKRTADEMDAGIGGTIRRLLSAAEGAFIAIGKAIEKPLVAAMERIRDAAEKLANWIEQNQDLVDGLLKVVVAIGALGGALVAVGVAAASLNAVIGLFIGAFAAAGTAIGITAAALAALLSPIGLVIAGVAALGAAIAVKTGAMGKAVDQLADVFAGLKDDALRSVAGIRDALQAGDISLAAKIMWLTLKKWWTEGVGWLAGIWAQFKSAFVDTGLTLWYGLQAGLKIAWGRLERAWYNSVAYLARVWSQFVAGIKAAWAVSQGFLAKAMAGTAAKMEGVNVEAVKKSIAERTARELAAIAINLDKKHETIENHRKRMIKESRKNEAEDLAAIGTKYDDAEKKRKQALAAELKKIEEDKANAIAKLRKAQEKAADKGFLADITALWQGRRGPKGFADAFKKSALQAGIQTLFGPLAAGAFGEWGDTLGAKLKELQKAVQETGQKGLAYADDVAARGTFAAAAVRGLGGGPPVMRIVSATEKTARGVDKLNDKADRNQQVFVV